LLDYVLLQVVISGLVQGSIYSLVSIGLTLIWGTMNIINFSHGSLMMMAMYGSFWAWTFFSLDPLVSLLLIFPVMYGVGCLLQRFIVGPILEHERHSQLLMTFGLGLVIKNLALHFWRSTYRYILTPYVDSVLRIGEVRLEVTRVMACVAAISLSIVCHLFLTRTSIGMAIRAVSQDRDGAASMGIDVRRIYGLTFGLGIGLAGAGGTIITTYFPTSPEVGDPFMLTAFVVMVLGGMGNYLGAMISGLIIGVTESVSAYLFSSSLRQAVALIIFILVLIVRPEGLFGRALRR